MQPVKKIKATSKIPKTGFNSASKNVYNKIGNIILPDGASFNFIKDPQSLFVQYNNLIRSLGKYYATIFPQIADKEDLFAYIADAFISLAIEYDPNSGVEFAGYIDTNLRKRIKYSYIQKYYKEKNRIKLLKSSDRDVSSIIAFRQVNKTLSKTDKEGVVTDIPNTDLDFLNDYDNSFEALLQQYESVVNLSTLDKLVLKAAYLGYNSPRKITEYIETTYPDTYTTAKINQSYKNLKTFLSIYYKGQIKL